MFLEGTFIYQNEPIKAAKVWFYGNVRNLRKDGSKRAFVRIGKFTSE